MILTANFFDAIIMTVTTLVSEGIRGYHQKYSCTYTQIVLALTCRL